MLVTEGARPDEVEEIFRNPDEWVARHGHHFNELIAARDAMGADYDPLKDKDPHGSMNALKSRAAVQTICAVSHLFHFRIAQANVDVFSSSAAVLAAWNLLFVAGTELATGERAFAVIEAPRIVGSKGGVTRWETDPKTAQKEQVRQCWCAWQLTPKSYRTKAAFARDMLDKYEHLKSQKNYKCGLRKANRKACGSLPILRFGSESTTLKRLQIDILQCFASIWPISDADTFRSARLLFHSL